MWHSNLVRLTLLALVALAAANLYRADVPAFAQDFTVNACVVPSGSTCTPSTGSDTATVTGQNYRVFWTVSPTPPAGYVIVVRTDGVTECSYTPKANDDCLVTSPANLRAGNSPIAVVVAVLDGLGATIDSKTVNHTVNKANTTTTITNVSALEDTTTAVGQAYNVQYRVSVNSPGGGNPTGTVTVTDGSASCNGTLTASTGNTATGSCNLTSTTPGLKKVVATYQGSSDYNGDASDEVDHVVSKGMTTTTITGRSPTTSVVGQPVAVNWTVSPAAATGTVTVEAGSSCQANEAAGQCSLVFTTAGPRTITATYSGDSNYFGSTSAGVSHTVNKAATTTAITNAAELAGANLFNGPHVVKWDVDVVAPGAGTPTGLVSVSVNGITACVAPVEAGECTAISVAPGAWNFTASYGGDDNFEGSVSAGVPQNATTIAITNAAVLETPSVVGQPVMVEWELTTASGTPSGNVNVTVNGGEGCSAPVSAGECSVTPTSGGLHILVATYEGDATFSGSSSSPVFHNVDKAASTTVISNVPALANPSFVGQPYDVAWSVSGPAGVTPTGFVTVRANGSFACSAPVEAGSCSITPSFPGAVSLTAEYGGDGALNGSASAAVPHSVQPKTPTATIVTNQDELNTPTLNNEPYTVRWQVTGGTPTGTVYVIGDGAGCSAPAEALECQITPNFSGWKLLFVIYAGDESTDWSLALAFHIVF